MLSDSAKMQDTSYFILVLSYQRTGSTRFRQDLESIGLGNPKEYALPFLRGSRFWDTLDFKKIIDESYQEINGSNFLSLKLMLNYANPVIRAVTHPGKKTIHKKFVRYPKHDQVLEFIKCLNEKNKSVAIFIVHRENLIDLVKSRTCAQLTNMYHLERLDGYQDQLRKIPSWKFSLVFLYNLIKARNEQRLLKEISQKLGDNALNVNYSEINSHPDILSGRINEYVGKRGIPTTHNQIVRESGNVKILNDSMTQIINGKLRKFFVFQILNLVPSDNVKEEN